MGWLQDGINSARVNNLLALAGTIAAVLVATYMFDLLAKEGGHFYIGFIELEFEVEYDILVIVLVAFYILAATRIAHVIGLPPGVVEIIMGAMLAFWGVKSTEVLTLLAAIGANLLLFMAGSEIDLALLRSILPQAVIVALVSALAPLALTALLHVYLGLSLTSSLVILASLSATSVALTYLLLSSYRLVRSRLGQLALASAMLLDLSGMIMLNIATASISPSLAFYIVILLAALLLYPLLPRLGGAPFEAEIRLITMTVIILGFLSDFVGVHSVLTSFILGVIASETVRTRVQLREKLESLATGFFTPFFFIASGMSIDPGIPLHYVALALAGGVALALARTYTVYFYFRLTGSSRRSSLIAASSTAMLLTVTIIAASVGFQLGLLDSLMYSVLVWIVVGTILGSFALVKMR